MRMLVLGGTVFVSSHVATEALTRGHDVTVACRGTSGEVPHGATHARLDRTGPIPPALAEQEFDAVVDVARQPSWVRAAVTAWPGAHWTFVSSVNVYVDDATPHASTDAALHPPRHADADLICEPEAYGPMKVACEQVVTDGATRAFVVRPGLIVGPRDPTGRFGYWVERLADAAAGEPVLAGGHPGDLVQVIDARDLAGWILDAAESGLTGVFDGVGPSRPIGDLLAEIAHGVGASPHLTWHDDAGLTAAKVQPWTGPHSLPLWLPRPEYDGMLARDWTPSARAGLRVRPIAQTAADTLAWLESTPEGGRTGLTRTEERAILGLSCSTGPGG
ncbi:NAD-dependent epimerase/dehydratase family protein [Nocardioides acrostichi]|uniref:NAD-dependent epimerase/dehydratase family protein n=1 Tax=Nocardioides acrostichi TaxID=2784339 RepID=A0A930UUP8_9ACTN|nr:NAD-dependent epimerase/dehydratase family protein [Nocardioides acrostichi]MBF4161203.1 NAD-dependent epimerase/dehydratase family protein [Nocardioides acrostichi]